ncbi:MAG: hypothetical protein ACP5H3_03970, partial [Candidatus Aenigmatarchaeota archaeon]
MRISIIQKRALTALIFGQHFNAFSKIRQIVQKKEGKIKLRIVKDRKYSVKDEEEIYGRIKSIVRGD